MTNPQPSAWRNTPFSLPPTNIQADVQQGIPPVTATWYEEAELYYHPQVARELLLMLRLHPLELNVSPFPHNLASRLSPDLHANLLAQKGLMTATLPEYIVGRLTQSVLNWLVLKGLVAVEPLPDQVEVHPGTPVSIQAPPISPNVLVLPPPFAYPVAVPRDMEYRIHRRRYLLTTAGDGLVSLLPITGQPGELIEKKLIDFLSLYEIRFFTHQVEIGSSFFTVTEWNAGTDQRLPRLQQLAGFGLIHLLTTVNLLPQQNNWHASRNYAPDGHPNLAEVMLGFYPMRSMHRLLEFTRTGVWSPADQSIR